MYIYIYIYKYMHICGRLLHAGASTINTREAQTHMHICTHIFMAFQIILYMKLPNLSIGLLAFMALKDHSSA